MLSFSWSKDGKIWSKAGETVDSAFLTRWDRVARPGLLHIGDSSLPAEYSFFTLINKE